jgi:hypothetical protein
VTAADGGGIGPGRAVARFVAALLTLGVAAGAVVLLVRGASGWLAWAALAPGAASLAMGFFDVQGRFLHDRLSRTKIVHEKTLEPGR